MINGYDHLRFLGRNEKAIILFFSEEKGKRFDNVYARGDFNDWKEEGQLVLKKEFEDDIWSGEV